MIVRAEMRMADEIDKGQARGEVATPGNPIVRGADNSEASLGDLGALPAEAPLRLTMG